MIGEGVVSYIFGSENFVETYISGSSSLPAQVYNNNIIMSNYTLLQNKRGRWFMAPPPPTVL